jgi:nitrate reductase NapAB chaperone NapD
VALDAMVDGFLDDLDATGTQGEPEREEQNMKDVLALDEEEPETEPDILDTESMEDDMEALLNGLSDPQEEQSLTEEKKPGLLKRLFGNIVTDEIAEAELAQKEADKVAAAEKEAADAQAKEEKAAAKAAKAEEKAAAKAAKAEEKALKKAADKEAKAAKKAEKEAKKAEEAAQAELEVTGKLNKVGVSIIAVLTVMFLTTEISGTNIFHYRSTLTNASNYFDMQKYTQAYQEILGTDVKTKDQETYDKIVTVMKVQRSINSYENYENMKYYPDALNALLVGLKKYDENIETAKDLEVDKDMDTCKAEILEILQDEFKLSEKEAYDILSLKEDAYTDKVVEIGMEQQ